MTRAAIAMGASIGDRARTLALAWAGITALPGTRAVAASRLYATPPAGGVARAFFLNAVVVVDTTLSAPALLTELRRLELRLGRRPTRRWADRALDLDLLLHGETVLDSPELRVPHPRIAGRAFVTVPLREVWPDAPDPRTGRPLLADVPPAVLPVAGVLRRLAGARRAL